MNVTVLVLMLVALTDGVPDMVAVTLPLTGCVAWKNVPVTGTVLRTLTGTLDAPA